MALPTAYLVTAKNLPGIINALISAKAPDKLTVQFLKSLGFTSSNDTLYIKLFRELGLIDSSGAPIERYYRFIDQSETKKVLAEAIEEGYSDLFALNKKAYELSEIDVKNKLKTLTQGQKEDNILTLMAKTFKALCDNAEFSKDKKSPPPSDKKTEDPKAEPPKEEDSLKEKRIKPSLHYNIEIHLPETRDQAVYDAIFKSFKDHLL